MRYRWDTAYTRKLFHFLIFTTATATHVLGGWEAVNALAMGVVFWVLYAVLIGNGFAAYEAMARERDDPHRTRFILIPLATTALGGMVSNIAFGEFALVGYLVTGWGDAVGEPVGRRFGRHRYRVASLFGVPAERSLEGSFTVGVASLAAAWLALSLGLQFPGVTALTVAMAVALLTAVVEAVSHHGLDNFTTMVAAAGVSWFMVGGVG